MNHCFVKPKMDNRHWNVQVPDTLKYNVSHFNFFISFYSNLILHAATSKQVRVELFEQFFVFDMVKGFCLFVCFLGLVWFCVCVCGGVFLKFLSTVTAICCCKVIVDFCSNAEQITNCHLYWRTSYTLLFNVILCTLLLNYL